MMACLAPLSTIVALFLGPLTMKLADWGACQSGRRYSEPVWQSAAAWRDLICAPISEELVFRALMLTVLLEAVRFYIEPQECKGGR
jgi:hypothetical protein